MISVKTSFEAPSTGPLSLPAAPHNRKGEPKLAVDQIQGNIFPGFSKDNQTLIFLRIDNAAEFARWLGAFVPLLATVEDVLAFNRLFKNLRRRQGDEVGVQATWLNVAFSFAGLKKLETRGMELDGFADEAFKAGMLARSKAGVLGDPVGKGTMGDPDHWLIGGPRREADVVILGAADTRSDLDAMIAKIVESLFPKIAAGGETRRGGATVLFRQDGDTLTGPLTGHEHFGFRDGISQPGVRGLLPDGTPLTPSQNPLNVNQGKPGQDLLWPGEFVFGYVGQSAEKEIDEPGIDPLRSRTRRAPEFARNGSFLVFRRLHQDVGGFHRFLGAIAQRFGVGADLVGARMVGRWPSGAPVVTRPRSDDPKVAADDCRNNNFEFHGDDDKPKPAQAAQLDGEACRDVSPPQADPTGEKVPFAGHIRKTYPRDDTSASIPELGERNTQTHRLLRRGIPYGQQSASTTASPVDDDVDRGLLFLAYQTSIVDQFEFVTRAWANNPDFKDGGTGFDPIIGQNAADPSRHRSFRLNLPGETGPIETDRDWVVPTGGGYYFAPSIKSLHALSGGETAHKKHANAKSTKAELPKPKPKRKPSKTKRVSIPKKTRKRGR
jgi:Dyp-type peroxidase family